MSNWGTMTAELLADGQKPDVTLETPRVQRAIVDSIALHSRERLFYMEKRGAVTLVEGQGTYSLGTTINNLPPDLLSISGDNIDVDINGDPIQRWQISHRPIETLDQVRRMQPLTGWPSYWSFYANNLEIWPAPNTTDLPAHIVRFRYLGAPGVPIKRLVSVDPENPLALSAWRFFKPFTTEFTDSDAAMGVLYPDPAHVPPETNEWFDTVLGYNVIRHHALYKLWSGPWRGSSDQAQQQQVMYLEALSGLKEWSDRKVSPRQVQPYGGEYS